MNAPHRNFLAVLISTHKTVVFIAAALLLAAATGWAMTGGGLEIATGGGHYTLQPIW